MVNKIEKMSFKDQYRAIFASPVMGISVALFAVTSFVFSGGQLPNTGMFMPHKICIVDQRLIAINVGSDLVIGFSYVVISSCLAWVAWVVRKGIPGWLLAAFAAFIISCGATHFMEVLTMYQPAYRMSAIVKIMCALASLSTASILPVIAVRFVTSNRE